MIGICCPGKISGVARIASAVDEHVVAACVAGLAGSGYVRPRQWKLRRAVVERSRLPGSRRVTGLAGLTEIPGDVIRIRGSLEITCVALIAICVDKLVIVVRMAGHTGGGHMGARQREFGRAVVERRGCPGRRRMTRLARLAEAARHVVWVLRSLIIGGVALIAIGIDKLVVATCVTRLARDREMGTGQRKFRRAVVKGRRLPGRSRMARRAILAEIACDVVGICGAPEIGGMALSTVRVHKLIVTISVA